MTAVALTIAGSDPSGGAGIQADLKTFSALGAYGASVLTALTAQNTLGVQGIHDVPAAFVSLQLESVLSDLSVRAAKIGMLSRPDVIDAVVDGLVRHRVGTVVVDPVMVATSGDLLLAPDAIGRLRDRLLPRALLLTPNLPEAAALLGEPQAVGEEEMADQAERLLRLGPRHVLVKGGHGDGPESVDVLAGPDGIRRIRAPRHRTRNTHGTGCTLSAAIAALLARDEPLIPAVEAAKSYLTAAIVAADGLAIGAGAGPVHHFHAVWG